MADRKKLAALPVAGTLTGAEIFYLEQGGSAKKVTQAALLAGATITKAAILAALGIDQFDVTSSTLTIGLAGKIIILPLE